ncbi:MAG TPA: BTAD domain-containing putative transcriptional regulator, partial [Actinoplanes sp.]|nr:BTAD domain-containing putative transcriptional regulator [Actinoplanes sp.]
MTGSSGGRWKDQPGQGVIVIGDGEPGAAMAAVLRRHRIGAGLTQDQLAGRAGLSVRTVRDIESGRVRAPRDRSLAALAAALGLSEAGRGELRSALAAVSATSDRAVSVGVLGPLSVTHGGRTIEVGRPLSRGLLGLLALRSGHPVSREEIIDVLWGECPPKTCNTLIHVQVARLRGRLEGPRTRHTNGRIVVLTGGGYLLDAGRVQVDLRQFDELASRARRALEEGSAEAACELFEQALRCWRGRVLADAGSRLRLHPDAVAAERRRMSTAIAYADNALGIGRHEQAAMRLHALASDEPLHEGLHARLMLALAGSGECAAALQVYAQIHRRLRDDLGIEPGDELRVAQQRVLRRQICEPDATAMPAHRPHRPAQLPAAPAAFVGRLDNLLALDGLLASPPEERPGVVLISGTAGVGKTALA